MARKSGEFGNLIPRKCCHLEGNLNLSDIKKYIRNSGKRDHIPGKFEFFRAVPLRNKDEMYGKQKQ